MNSSMISPYLYFEGDFQVEWVYKCTETAAGAGRMYLELRDWRYGSPVLNLGERHSDNKFLLDILPESKTDADLYQPEFGDFDFSQGARYTMVRTLTEDHAVYVLTVTSVANPEQTFTRTINYAEERWNEPVLFHWKNEAIAGEYSCIRWESFDADEVTEPISVSISNKSELTQEWILGKADRTVSVSSCPILLTSRMSNLPSRQTIPTWFPSAEKPCMRLRQGKRRSRSPLRLKRAAL